MTFLPGADVTFPVASLAVVAVTSSEPNTVRAAKALLEAMADP